MIKIIETNKYCNVADKCYYCGSEIGKNDFLYAEIYTTAMCYKIIRMHKSCLYKIFEKLMIEKADKQ